MLKNSPISMGLPVFPAIEAQWNFCDWQTLRQGAGAVDPKC
jgi:hypothetical protein